jgi:hypothetical protein
MGREITHQNFRRVAAINWLLTGPALVFFAWPYVRLSEAVGASDFATLLGAGLFSISFTLTIVHGHISLAVGDLHRVEFHRWTRKRSYPWRLAYHPALFRYRTRLALLVLSIAALLG